MKCFESRAGQVFWVVGVFAVLLILSSTAYGSSKKWRANNNSDKTVKVFWTAAGCAGVKKQCVPFVYKIYFVCKTKILQPGESSHYKFKGGTSAREKAVCRKDGTDNMRALHKTSDRKKNEIRLTDDGFADWYW